MQTLRFTDNGAELQNPGVGWALHYYDNVPTNYGSRLAPSELLSDWPGLGFVYLRLPWSCVERAEGRFNWSVVDTPMQRFRERGLQACFRFTCSESWMEYPTPKWVETAGARGYRFRPGQGTVPDGPFWEPDFDDPVFLEKLDRFLAAAAARYDGHPDVAFIDIGSFGVWGEGHTWSSTRKAYPAATIKRHIDMHLNHFRRTRVVGMDDFLSRPGTALPWLAGVNERGFDLVVPFAWRERAFDLWAGLWQPGRTENGGRLLPYGGAADRRVRLGRLSLDATGRPGFDAAAIAWPEGELPAGSEFAVAWAGVRHDAVRQPHSLKLRVRLLLPDACPQTVQAFVHLTEPDLGREVFCPHEEREDADLTRYMAEHGLGMRDDSILVQPPPAAYFHAEMCQQFWPRAPVVIESEHYGGSAHRGCWGDGSAFLQAIEDTHASYASIHWWPQEFLEQNRDLVRRINSRLGYRFRLAEMRCPASVPLGGVFALRWSWQNAGVAPPYTDYYPTITLKDSQGGLTAVWVDERSNLRELPVVLADPPAVTVEREFGLPFQLRGGQHAVFVSVGDRLGKPAIALPLAEDDGQRRYRVGTLTVTGDFAVRLVAARLDSGQLVLETAWELHRTDATTTPFFHLDRAGALAWAGGPDVTSATGPSFVNPGTVSLTFAIALPGLSPGDSLSVSVGLWRPDRVGREDERLTPDEGQTDRRVVLGTLRVAADGSVGFLPAN